MGIWTSDKIKKLMIKRCSFANGYVGAATEVTNLNSADVIGVKFAGSIQEFEIKVSRSDLIGELRCARVAAGLDTLEQYVSKKVQLSLETDGIERTPEQLQAIKDYGHTLSKTKLKKHRLYLSKPQDRPQRPDWSRHLEFVPHTFYWCIPYELLDVCRELNKGLPYGIYVIDNPQMTKWDRKYIVKPARGLGHQGKHIFYAMFNRVCTQWADDRHRLEYLEEKLAEKQSA